MVQDKACKYLRKLEEGNGLDAYKRLRRKHDRKDEISATSLMEQVMAFKSSDQLEQLEDSFDELDALVKKHDDIAQDGEEVPGGIIKTLLLTRMPEPIKTHVQLNQDEGTRMLTMPKTKTQGCSPS